jgi:hypothetical protein
MGSDDHQFMRGSVVNVSNSWSNIVGSIPVMDHLVCDLGQVTLLQLLHPLNDTENQDSLYMSVYVNV